MSSVVQRVLAKILEMAGGLGGIKGLGRCDSLYYCMCACVRVCDSMYYCACVCLCVCVSHVRLVAV